MPILRKWPLSWWSLWSCVVTRVLCVLAICLCVLRDVTLLNPDSPGFCAFRLAGTEDGRERQCGWSPGDAILSESVARRLRRPYSSAQRGHRHTKEEILMSALRRRVRTWRTRRWEQRYLASASRFDIFDQTTMRPGAERC